MFPRATQRMLALYRCFRGAGPKPGSEGGRLPEHDLRCFDPNYDGNACRQYLLMGLYCPSCESDGVGNRAVVAERHACADFAERSSGRLSGLGIANAIRLGQHWEEPPVARASIFRMYYD